MEDIARPATVLINVLPATHHMSYQLANATAIQQQLWDLQPKLVVLLLVLKENIKMEQQNPVLIVLLRMLIVIAAIQSNALHVKWDSSYILIIMEELGAKNIAQADLLKHMRSSTPKDQSLEPEINVLPVLLLVA